MPYEGKSNALKWRGHERALVSVQKNIIYSLVFYSDRAITILSPCHVVPTCHASRYHLPTSVAATSVPVTDYPKCI